MVCAVCDKTNATMRLCDLCRRKPENAGWSQGADEQLTENIESFAPSGRLAELQDHALPHVGERTRVVLQLVYGANISIPYRPRGRERYRLEWRWESRPLSLSEIAHLVGCSREAVRRIIHRTILNFHPVGDETIHANRERSCQPPRALICICDAQPSPTRLASMR
jgi:hypothetical protein